MEKPFMKAIGLLIALAGLATVALAGGMPLEDDDEIVKVIGIVVHKEMEGGFFAIDGDDGKTYDPINLPEAFKRDGLKVKLTARVRKDAISIHMVGDIIEIVDISAN